jgi:hypothetical protein
VLALTSCTVTAPAAGSSTVNVPSATGEASVSSAASSSPASTPVPTYDAAGTADHALAAFTQVVRTLLQSDPQPHGRDVIDALVRAGFDKKAMEVTLDDTTIGRGVDSIEFSVAWKKSDCLLGQVGSAGFFTSAAPILSTGKCLVGTTRPITW